MGKYRLKKKERLSGKKRIDELFQEGRTFFYPPLRVVWIEADRAPGRPPARMAIAVSRKNFKRAVDRNLIKRRIREAYRKNKVALNMWLEENNRALDVVFIYTASQIPAYRDIEEKIMVTLQKIIKEYEKVND
ncbi:MAG: ribonuclease P protein component [Bacteroidales bacterium]|nr:ribonuclease P protein component [Bacteroidales bacterium]